VKYAGGSWQTVGTAGFSAHCAFHLSLAIDSADIPYVAYADGYGYPGSPATVMKCVSGSWQTVGTTGFSAGGATSPSLAIDSTGTPYVAYEDEAYNGRATLMKYAGGSWRTVGTVGFNWITNPYNIVQAIYPSLAIDSTGTPYVAFAELIYPYNFGATVMRFK